MPEPVAVAFVIFGVAAAACLLVATGRMLYVLWLESAYVEEEPLTLSPTLPSDVSPEEAAAIRAALEGDAAMLRRDWEAVGSDMRRAMERLDKEIAEGRFP